MRVVAKMAVTALSLCLVAALAHAQDRPRPDRPDGPRPGDPAQMAQQQLDRLKQALQGTDDQWKQLEPQIQKILKLRAELAAQPLRRARRADRPDAADASALAKAQQALQTVIQDKAATPEQIEIAMKTFRDARDATEKDLEQTRAATKALVTPRQEAVLALYGILK